MVCTSTWFGLFTFTVDFKNFFLSGDMLEEEKTYMEQPKGFVAEGYGDHVCELVRSIYGHPSSPRRAQAKLIEGMNIAGARQLDSDPMVFHLDKEKSSSMLGSMWTMVESTPTAGNCFSRQ
jgi:hypothetical protein